MRLGNIYRQGAEDVSADGGSDAERVIARCIEPRAQSYRPQPGAEYRYRFFYAAHRSKMLAPEVPRPQKFAHRNRSSKSESVEEQRRKQRRLGSGSPGDDEQGDPGGRDRVGERRQPPRVETPQTVAPYDLGSQVADSVDAERGGGDGAREPRAGDKMETVEGFHRARYIGLGRSGLCGELVATAYNTVRMSRLIAEREAEAPVFS